MNTSVEKYKQTKKIYPKSEKKMSVKYTDNEGRRGGNELHSGLNTNAKSGKFCPYLLFKLYKKICE